MSTPGDEPSKKLLEKQLRRQAEESKKHEAHKAARRRNLITIAVVLVVSAAVGFGVLYEATDSSTAAIGVPAAEAGCSGIERPEEQGQEHIDDGADHPPYSSDPPTSGPHYQTPADADFYETPLAVETLIHNMEHGQIVLWYSLSLGESELEQLRDITRDEVLATIAVPYAGLPAGASVAMTAWGAMQSCEEISQEAIDKFRSEFQGRGPEDVGVPIFD